MASNQQRTIELRRLNLKYASRSDYQVIAFEAVVTPSRSDDVIEWSGSIIENRSNYDEPIEHIIPTGTTGNILAMPLGYAGGGNYSGFSMWNVKVTCGDLKVTGSRFGYINIGEQSRSLNGINILSSVEGDSVSSSGGVNT